MHTLDLIAPRVNKLHNLWFCSTVPAVTDKFNLCWLHSPPTHKESFWLVWSVTSLAYCKEKHTHKQMLSISQLSTIGEFAYTQVNKLHNLWFFSTVLVVTDKFNLCWLHSPPTHKEVSDWCDQSHTHKYCTHTLSQSSVHCMNLPIHRSTVMHTQISQKEH